jgi:hypothetical protein
MITPTPTRQTAGAGEVVAVGLKAVEAEAEDPERAEEQAAAILHGQPDEICAADLGEGSGREQRN